tara:strand:+ start:208 stop:390 length:183 start_codon:yes stop_codon:yes gene_type:complete
MNKESRLISLETKHKELDKQIDQVYKHTHDDVKLKELKKQKLMVKQEMTQIKTQGETNNG